MYFTHQILGNFNMGKAKALIINPKALKRESLSKLQKLLIDPSKQVKNLCVIFDT